MWVIDDEAVLNGDNEEDDDDSDIEEDGNVADLIDDDVTIEDDHGLLIEYGPICHIVKLPKIYFWYSGRYPY